MKTLRTIILTVLAIAAIVWAVSFPFDGIAWFPGAIAAIFFGIRILEINQTEEDRRNG